jgi:hypothetical protein
MTDRGSLKFIGVIFGGVTAIVMVFALLVVRNHLDGRLMLDDNAYAVVGALKWRERQGVPQADWAIAFGKALERAGS